MKQGIIVVNHGTSDFEARHNTIEEFVLSIGDRFEDADIAIKFNRLSHTIDEGMHGGRGRKPMKLTYEDILDMIKYFKSYYENLGEDKDKLLSKKIREAVNGSLDYLKKRLDFDKIE